VTADDRGVLGPWVYQRDEDGWRWANIKDPDTVYERTPTGARTLVVGADNGDLLVIEADQARALATAWAALRLDDVDQAIERLPEPYRSEVEDLRAEAAAEGETLDMETLHDWVMEGGLEWPTQEMLTLLPPPIIDRFGEKTFSGVSGPCLRILAGHRDALVAALAEEGYTVLEDDALVRAASGGFP
jgi:hypothetical protein